MISAGKPFDWQEFCLRGQADRRCVLSRYFAIGSIVHAAGSAGD
ncbi:hypothetical protein SELSPUOL_01896 [Selenomonas sputigena ATCC 35185]|uniref:Uncharacterized protein n=1 Tax=Selenomonas sputigena (strain ATCC 35185 / DSM 20758 / CCUG 44933 / VPI D19B-28) TaxID=546271 RepID=C9LWP1_SELS3|nr:hypothetical protein SELSPUOL_01896 [Selenomonas sputigena ATCC 35185]